MTSLTGWFWLVYGLIVSAYFSITLVIRVASTDRLTRGIYSLIAPLIRRMKRWTAALGVSTGVTAKRCLRFASFAIGHRGSATGVLVMTVFVVGTLTSLATSFSRHWEPWLARGRLRRSR